MSRTLIQEGLIALSEISRDKVSLRSMSPSRTLNLSTMPSGPDNSPGSRFGGVGGPGAVKVRNKPLQKIFDRFKGKIKGNIQRAKDQGITPTYNRVRNDTGGHIEVRYPGSQSIGSFEISGGTTRGRNPSAYSYDILDVFKRK